MNWMQGNAENKREKKRRETQMKFFLKGELACMRQMQEHKETIENFIQNWSATKSPMLEYIDLGVK